MIWSLPWRWKRFIHKPENTGSYQKLESEKNTFSFQPPEGSYRSVTSILVQQYWFWTSGLQIWRTNFCWFKPPSLWQFITTATGSKHSWEYQTVLVYFWNHSKIRALWNFICFYHSKNIFALKIFSVPYHTTFFFLLYYFLFPSLSVPVIAEVM